ncbi:Probable GTP diphosphokinase RSH3, chloroplastic [Linum grandiflorum]
MMMMMMIVQKSWTPLLLLHHHHRCFCYYSLLVAHSRSYVLPKRRRRRRLSSSLVASAPNLIAAAAASSSSTASLHGAVSSAITQVALTAVAIASGACLSTKVDFLWPKLQDLPFDSFAVEGVDVSGCSIFSDPQVLKAIAFAKTAHHGQFRRTGDPYLTHCIHTARILAMLVPPAGQRATDTVIAGILHDVVDDTNETLNRIEQEFGIEVARLVAGVSRLSYINQLLRRHRRINVNQATLGQDEANNLRVMLLGMVDDPRVVLIKLADRLHNMRTIYALPPSKAQAVAQETLLVWCSLASRLGLWSLQAELEDLCFAVLQPLLFRKMRADLGSMWTSTGRDLFTSRAKKGGVLTSAEENSTLLGGQFGVEEEEDVPSMKDLLEAVLPFDILSDRRKRTMFIESLKNTNEVIKRPKVVLDAGIALASLVTCEEALERELFISTSYVPGMEVSLSSRLKSLYSIYSKMKRKEVGINKIYDSRALRVVVGDKKGTLKGPAIHCCYSLLDTIHRLWTPVDGEFDDYIVNPKPSGYQSLHTAVQGPDGAPLEVQIRTQKMHDYAEHGLAAHWLYKEAERKFPSLSNMDESEAEASYCFLKDTEDHNSMNEDQFQKCRFLRVGHPVLRVEGSHLLAAVIIRIDEGGKALLLAVSSGMSAPEAVADRKSSCQVKRWEAYARLYKKVTDEWWCEPGHGDWCIYLEKFILCRDGMYHKQDQFERILPTFIQVIELTEEEESEYWEVVAAVFEGKAVDDIMASKATGDSAWASSSSTTPTEASINNKVRLLRAMLGWEEQLRSGSNSNSNSYRSSSDSMSLSMKKSASSVELGEVVVICWPNGDIMRLSNGSTAGDAARRIGLEGKVVAVNGHLVLPSTPLKDGDVVEVRH